MTDEEKFQDECDRIDEEWENRTTQDEETPDDTPCLEIYGTVFDPNL